MLERRCWLGALALAVAACGTPARRPPVVGEIPVVRGAGEATLEERKELDKAHRDLASGNLQGADKRFRQLAARHPKLVAARTGIAYVRLKQGANVEAARLFAAILAERPLDLDALLGAGEAATRLNEPAEALEHYRHAVEVHPSDATARKRFAETKLQFTEQRLAAARSAIEGGRTDDAIAEYRLAIRAVPEVAGLRLELAKLLADRNELKEAAAVLESDKDPDAQALAWLGGIRLRLRDYPGAIQAYGKALEKDPNDVQVQERLAEAHRTFEFAKMPEEYQRIYSAPQLTRADLAALVDVKVTALSRLGAFEPKVAVDISGSWAKDHIIKTLAFDIISVYPNHTFQPGAMVRRGDLARAVARVLDLLQWPPGNPPAITDMGRSNLYYDAVSRVVGAGLMDLTPDGAFEAWRPVSGQQAVDVIESLSRLVGP
jgi:tetratricopeptide (TPR) repeat protein